MTARLTEEFPTCLVDCSLFVLGDEMPPREPNDDDDDEDENEEEDEDEDENENEEDEEQERPDEPPIVREPDEDGL
jgi:hypothetical protein